MVAVMTCSTPFHRCSSVKRQLKDPCTENRDLRNNRANLFAWNCFVLACKARIVTLGKKGERRHGMSTELAESNLFVGEDTNCSAKKIQTTRG